MRSFNVKKLAAIALGGAMIGAALAPAFATLPLKTDIYSGTDGSASLSIVVGAKAAITDGIAAAKIAAAIAANSVVNKTVDATGTGAVWNDPTGFSANVTVGTKVSSVTAGLNKEMKVDLNSGGYDYKDSSSTPNAYAISTSSSDTGNTPFNYSSLTISNKTFSEKINTTASLSIKESLIYGNDKGSGTGPTFDATTLKDLVLPIVTQSMVYEINLGNGLPGLNTSFTDTNTDVDVKIPLFGKEYNVKSLSSTQLELIVASAESTYEKGMEIPNLLGTDGKTYKAIVGDGAISGTTNKISLSLYDANTKLSEKYVSSGQNAADVLTNASGNLILKTGLYVNEVLKTSTSPDIYKSTILVGTDRILLVHNSGYPYDSSKTTNFDWKVGLTYGATNLLTKIQIYNDNLTKTSEKALKASAAEADRTISFPESYGKVVFNGFKGTEEMTTIAIGTVPNVDSITTTDTTIQGLYFVDDSQVAHSIPFYIPLTSKSASSCDGVKFDGQSYAIGLHPTEATPAIDSNFVMTSGTSKIFNFVFDYNTTGNSVDINGITQALNIGAGSTTLQLQPAITEGGTFDLNGVTFTVVDTNYGAFSKIVVRPNGGYITVSKGTTCLDRLTSSSWSVDILRPSTSGVSGGNYATAYNATAADENSGLALFFDDSSVNYSLTDKNVYIDLLSGKNTNKGYRYVPFVNKTNNKGYLLLAAQQLSGASALKHSKGLDFNGTAADTENALPAYKYYIPDNTDFHSAYSNTFDSPNEYVTAIFKVDDRQELANINSFDINVYIDTENGKPLTYSTERTAPSVNVDYNGEAAITWQLGGLSTSSTYKTWGYTDFGSKIDWDATIGKVTITMPQGPNQVYATLLGPSATQTTATTGEIVNVAKGATAETASGSKVTLNDVNYTKGSVTAATCTTAPVKQAVESSIVIKNDSGTQTGTVIAIGGWKVNRVTKAVTGIADKLAKKGDKVVDMVGSTIVVAGYTAADTTSAADELIAILAPVA